MKKIGLMALALVLVGAGCFGGADKIENENDDANAPTMAVPAPGSEDVDEMIVDDGPKTTTVEVIGDGEFVVEAVDPEEIVDLPNGSMAIKSVSMKAGNFFFAPASIAAEAGQTVEITFTENAGTHTFVIDEIGFKKTVKAGETISFTAPSKGGTYEFYCDIGQHRANGMFGSLHVKEL